MSLDVQEEFQLRLASSLNRMNLELQAARAYQRIQADWFRELSDQMRSGGYLQRIARHAFHHRHASMPRRERRALAHANVNAIASEVFTAQENSSFETRTMGVHSKIHPEAYRMGAITGLHLFTMRPGETSGKTAFELRDPTLLFHMQSRTLKFGRRVTSTVVEDARRLIVDRLYFRGETPEEVATVLASAKNIPLRQSKKLALTEIQSGVNSGLFDQGFRSGIRSKSWLTVGDNRVRFQHVDNSIAGYVPIYEPFPSGQMHPGDGVLSVNCRCSMTFNLIDLDMLDPWEGSSGPYLSSGLTDAFGF